MSIGPALPACPKCGRNNRVHHFVYWDFTGHPETAWFQCLACAEEWTDFKLSEALLAVENPSPAHP